MADPDTGEFEGLPPAEATDSDEVGELEGTDPGDDWEAADRYGVTPREEDQGEPLDLRLTEELPDDAPPDDEDDLGDTPLGEHLRLTDDGSG